MGVVPGSLPTPELPQLRLVPSLVFPALALAFVALVQGAGISATFPNPDGNYPDASRDFIGQGAANVAAGVMAPAFEAGFRLPARRPATGRPAAAAGAQRSRLDVRRRAGALRAGPRGGRQQARRRLVGDEVRRQLEVAGIIDVIGPENVYRGDERVGAAVRRAYDDAIAWVAANEQAVAGSD